MSDSTQIYAISGGPKYKLTPEIEERGYIWEARPMEEIISVPGSEVTLVVDNYPEIREDNELDRAVTIKLIRSHSDMIILQFQIPLSFLIERPQLLFRST